MTITELIRELKHLEADHGDLEVYSNDVKSALKPIRKPHTEPIRDVPYGPIRRVVVIEA
jgi:hypothetical protein